MLDLTGNINYMDNLNYLVPNEAVGNEIKIINWI